MHNTLQRLFQYKAWADDQLLAALAALKSDAIEQLAIQALSHTYVVDRIFAAHLRGRAHGYTAATLSTMPCLADLAADLRASDREYVEYVSRLDESALADRIDFSFTDGARGLMSREEVLMHVITHGVGHRGQVSAVMLLNSVAPTKDGFATFLHDAEASRKWRAAA